MSFYTVTITETRRCRVGSPVRSKIVEVVSQKNKNRTGCPFPVNKLPVWEKYSLFARWWKTSVKSGPCLKLLLSYFVCRSVIVVSKAWPTVSARDFGCDGTRKVMWASFTFQTARKTAVVIDCASVAITSKDLHIGTGARSNWKWHT